MLSPTPKSTGKKVAAAPKPGEVTTKDKREELMKDVVLQRGECEYKVALKPQRSRNDIVVLLAKTEKGWTQKLQLVVSRTSAFHSMLIMKLVAAEHCHGTLEEQGLRKRRDQLADAAANGKFLEFLKSRLSRTLGGLVVPCWEFRVKPTLWHMCLTSVPGPREF